MRIGINSAVWDHVVKEIWSHVVPGGPDEPIKEEDFLLLENTGIVEQENNGLLVIRRY